ncbi:MAG: insulinase family protein [Deltaproteobacteria bacterium]|nr:insulinase family protein [Deltaproteobacteria bacterium]
MRKRVLIFLLICSFFILEGQLLALDKPPIKRIALNNGMTFLLWPRPASPSVAYEVRVKVGSVDDPRHLTGLAHMLEHMMFKGTQAIGTSNYKKEKALLKEIDKTAIQIQSSPSNTRNQLEERLQKLIKKARAYQIPNEFDRLYSQAGGINLNAYTSADLTSYHVTLPRGHIELWAAIERDRTLHPVFREFYKERSVVLKERSQRVDASDKGRLFEEFLFHAFTTSPYRFPVIGMREDIGRLTRADLKKFYNKYYIPANTVVAIVGGFDPERVISTIRNYFDDIPTREVAPTFVSKEDKRALQVRIHLESDKEPFMIMGFLKPTLPNIDDTCFDIIQEVLTGSKTSRLYNALVTEKHIASQIDAYNGFPGSRYDNLFVITASPLPGHTNKELEEAIWEELDKLKQEPLEEQEIKRAIKSIKKSILSGMETNEGAAGLISYFEAIAGDYAYIYKNIEDIENVDIEMIMGCAKKYLGRQQAIIGFMGKDKASPTEMME